MNLSQASSTKSRRRSGLFAIVVFFFQSTPVDGYRGLVEVIASEQLQLHLVLAVVEAVELF